MQVWSRRPTVFILSFNASMAMHGGINLQYMLLVGLFGSPRPVQALIGGSFRVVTGQGSGEG